MDQEIRTLEGVGVEVILTALNLSFSDYFVPLQLSTEQLLSKMQSDKTDLGLSVGVFEDDTLIAFMLHGFDVIEHRKVIYNGGTGVIPERRGSGLTQEMYRFVLPLLKYRGVNKVVLEVVSENIQAIKSYERSGFVTKRELLCYKGELPRCQTNPDVEIKRFSDYDWPIMTSFWDIHPTWQNSKNVVNDLKTENVSLAAYDCDQLVGYLVYDPRLKRIQQIAVSKTFRRKGIASALLSELSRTSETKVSVINVDKASEAMHAFFGNFGLEVYLKQFEMELEMN